MYDQFSTDEGLENNGIVVDYGDFRVGVARTGGSNKKWQKLLNSMTRPYKRAIATETMNDDLAEDIYRSAFAQSIVKSWEVKNANGKWVSGIEAPTGGKLLTFNVENVSKTLKALPDLYADLREQSGTMALYRSALMEQAAKN